MVAEVIPSSSFERIVSSQIVEIKRQIKVIDERLSQLGNSEEDRIESILLEAAKRHLLEDLRRLSSCLGDKKSLVSPTVSKAVVEA